MTAATPPMVLVEGKPESMEIMFYPVPPAAAARNHAASPHHPHGGAASPSPHRAASCSEHSLLTSISVVESSIGELASSEAHLPLSATSSNGPIPRTDSKLLLLPAGAMPPLPTESPLGLGGVGCSSSASNNNSASLHHPHSASTSSLAPPAAKFLSRSHPSKYLKVKQLGEGGCGVVWLVQRASDGLQFAAKVVRLGSNPMKRQYAINEPVFLMRCNSPFVVRYEEHWTDHKHAVVTVMELIEGVDLCTHIRAIASKAAFHTRQLRRYTRGLPLSSPDSPLSGNIFDHQEASMAMVPLTEAKLQQLQDPAVKEHVLGMRRIAMSEMETSVVFAQILIGVRHVHVRGFVHRDLKLGNIFLAKLGLVKISDFGLSCAQSDADEVNARRRSTACKKGTFSGGSKGHSGFAFLHDDAVGTPSYLAPELWCTQEMPPYSTKSDMWALGVILFEMLTGRMAFPAQRADHSDTGAAILSGYIPDLRRHAPDVSQPMVDMVHLLLSPEPANRPSVQRVLEMPMIHDAVALLTRVVSADASLAAIAPQVLKEIDMVYLPRHTAQPPPPPPPSPVPV